MLSPQLYANYTIDVYIIIITDTTDGHSEESTTTTWKNCKQSDSSGKISITCLTWFDRIIWLNNHVGLCVFS